VSPAPDKRTGPAFVRDVSYASQRQCCVSSTLATIGVPANVSQPLSGDGINRTLASSGIQLQHFRRYEQTMQALSRRGRDSTHVDFLRSVISDQPSIERVNALPADSSKTHAGVGKELYTVASTCQPSANLALAYLIRGIRRIQRSLINWHANKAHIDALPHRLSAWGIHYCTEIVTVVFERTRDARFLDLLVPVFDLLTTGRDHQFGYMDELRGRTTKAWSSKPPRRPERACEPTVAGLILNSLAMFADVILRAVGTTQKHRYKAEAYLQLIPEVVTEFDEDIRVHRDGHSLYYVARVEGGIEPHNHVAPLATAATTC
jgi:hypothetical protein